MPSMVWRATFIDVSDEKVTYNRLRSRSLPCLPDFEEATDLFREERAYVAELDERLASFALEPDLCGRGALQEFDDVFGLPPPELEESEVQRRNRMVSSMLLGAKIWDRDVDELTPRATIFDTETREPSPSSSDIEEACPVPVFVVKGYLKEPGCNKGSIGHPALCARPCLYFATGQCASGDSCEYCHLAHTKRAPHLNKKHRDLLRDMEPVVAKAVFLPLVREKALAFDDSNESAFAVDLLASACGVAGVACPRLSGVDRSLTLALRGLSLRVLLLTFKRSFLSQDNEADKAVDALVEHMRSVA